MTWPTKNKFDPAGAARGEQIERDVGIAAQTVVGLAVAHPLGHQLPDHIDLAVEHIAECMGVVGGNIIALRRRDIKPAAGEEEEFVDLDVRRQAVVPQRLGIGEVRITAEKPSGNRIEKTPFQLLSGARFSQCQSGENPQCH